MSEPKDKPNKVTLDGREHVILPSDEYDRLAGLARVAEMPPLPEPDEEGTYPAVEHARASIARDLVRSRTLARLTRRELARLAELRVETLLPDRDGQAHREHGDAGEAGAGAARRGPEEGAQPQDRPERQAAQERIVRAGVTGGARRGA